MPTLFAIAQCIDYKIVWKSIQLGYLSLLQLGCVRSLSHTHNFHIQFPSILPPRSSPSSSACLHRAHFFFCVFWCECVESQFIHFTAPQKSYLMHSSTSFPAVACALPIFLLRFQFLRRSETEIYHCTPSAHAVHIRRVSVCVCVSENMRLSIIKWTALALLHYEFLRFTTFWLYFSVVVVAAVAVVRPARALSSSIRNSINIVSAFRGRNKWFLLARNKREKKTQKKKHKFVFFSLSLLVARLRWTYRRLLNHIVNIQQL